MASSVLALGAAALAVWALGQRGGAAGERVEFAYRAILEPHNRPYISISNDGRRIAQVRVDSNGVSLIAIRDLGSSQMRVLPGTNGAQEPSFSPDGTWLVYQASGRLWRVPADGGPPSAIADSVNNPGASVGDDGSLYYSHSGLGLHRKPASGEPAVPLTTLDRSNREFGHWSSQVLPGGKALIFTNFLAPSSKSRIESLIIATGERKVLVEGAVYGRYTRSGHLLFARDGAIFAVAFDAASLTVSGTPVPVIEDVAWSLTNGAASYAVSNNGTLVYVRASEELVDKQLVWADRQGNLQPVFSERGSWEQPSLSPDGRWLAFTRTEPSVQIWLYDLSRRVLSQLTRYTDGVEFSPTWMPDSRSLIISREVPQYDLWRLPIDGSVASPVLESIHDKRVTAVSSDGQFVAYAETVAQNLLKIAPIAGGEARIVSASDLDQNTADFSPDGRWIVFDEISGNGTMDVFVRDSRAEGGRRPVSATGGNQPSFTKNGREIVYRRGAAVLAASFDPATGEVGTPELLFTGPDGGRIPFSGAKGYGVTPDGARFLISAPVERPDATPTVVVTNWLDELRRKVPR